MSRYEKRTNNCYRSTTLRKEKKRPKATEHRLVELKSMTFEFLDTRKRDAFFGSLMNALKKEGIGEYFTTCVQEGNTIVFSTKATKPYKTENYEELLWRIGDSISRSDVFDSYCGEYTLAKLYTRKGKKHLFFVVSVDFDYVSPNYNLLPGVDDTYFWSKW